MKSCHRYRGEHETERSGHTDGTLTCPSCLDRIRGDLGKLPTVYRECAEALVTSRGRGLDGIRTRRRGGVSLNEAAVAARSELVSVAVSWTAFVAQRRRAPDTPRRDIPLLAAFLLTHLPWLATRPDVVPFAAELTRALRLGEEAVEAPATRRFALGACDRAGCESTVYATVGASASTGVVCDGGHRWPPNEWLRLSRKLGARMVERATVDR